MREEGCGSEDERRSEIKGGSEDETGREEGREERRNIIHCSRKYF